MYGNGQLRLSAMMGTYPKTRPLKGGTVASKACELVFSEIEVAQKGFKSVVRKLKYDVAELAIVTFLQAFAAGKPYVLLPFVMNGGFHHKSILCRAEDKLEPGALAGRTIAMRAYTQTTPTWVRGILSDEYGLKVEAVRWLSQEGAHVAEYQDPDWVRRLDSSLSLEATLLEGEADAIIAGSGLSGDARVRPLLPDPKAAAMAWYARHRVVPINHMVAVRKELASARPDLVREIYRMLQESRRIGEEKPAGQELDLQPIGFEAVKPALEMIIRFSLEQRLIPQRYPVEALFGEALEAIS